MHPELFRIDLGGGTRTIYAYGTLLLLGMAVGILIGRARARSYGIEPFDVSAMGLLGCCGGVAGAWLLYQALHFRELLIAPSEAIAHPGLVFYGGLGGAFAAGFAYLRGYGIPVGGALDAAAPAVPIGHALGRVGCFLGGCCYGAPTDSALGVRFPSPWTPAGEATLAAAPRALHPVQLYEAAGLLVLGAALLALGPWLRPRAGRLFLGYVAGYAVLRLLTEWFRGDAAERKFLVPGVLSTSQAIALAALVVVVAIHVRTRSSAA